MSELHLQSLKDLGVQRVVALHSNPAVMRLCNKMDVEYVPAFLENGDKTDLGRKIFGKSVSYFLLKKPTYIFCFFGKDRTGGVIARFRTENGWSCEQAYNEAKSFGFSDLFVDLIDWFSEFCLDKPVDTNKVRKFLNGENPYVNPELSDVEQDCLSPTPNDVPDPTGTPSAPLSYTSNMTNSQVPFSFTVPLSVRSSIVVKSYINPSDQKILIVDNDISEILTNLNNIEIEDNFSKNMTQGLDISDLFKSIVD